MIQSYREKQKRIVDELRYGSATDLNHKASIVPMRADFRTDPALALTSVVFVPDEMAHQIHCAVIEPLRTIEPQHHYYSPEAMHLTIKNVRRISAPPRFSTADIKRVSQLFERIIPRHLTFSVSLEELVSFKTSVSLIGYSDRQFQALVRALDVGLKEIGLPDDKQYVSDTVFFGNVTLCRFVNQPSPAFFERVAELANRHKWVLPVKQIQLVTCNAVCWPETRTLWQTFSLSD